MLKHVGHWLGVDELDKGDMLAIGAALVVCVPFWRWAYRLMGAGFSGSLRPLDENGYPNYRGGRRSGRTNDGRAGRLS